MSRLSPTTSQLSKEKIKRQVSIEQVLVHLGHNPNERGIFQCPFPERHNNGDANPSCRVSKDRVYCNSQKCFGEKGADIFGFVELMENLPTFPEQKAWIVKVFGLSHATVAESRIVQTYEYTDAAGNVAFQTLRYEPKDFRQRRPNGKGGWIWNLQGVKLVLYRLPEVMAADKIVLFEGEKDADSAYHLGLPPGYAATTSPMGAEKWKFQYSESLRDKVVVICPDRDEPGQKHGKQIAAALEGMAKEVLWLNLPEGKDVSEWIKSTGATAEDLQRLLKSAKPVQPEEAKENPQKDFRENEATDAPFKSQATQLINLGKRCEFFHDKDGQGYASFKVDDHMETWSIRRKAFKRWLARAYFLQYKKAPGSQAIQDALGVLEGQALFQGECREVFTRAGGDNKVLYLDLGDPDWNMVKITGGGWEIMPHGDIKFRRGAGTLPLPTPVSGGNLRELLSPFLNLKSDYEWTLLIGYLVAALRVIGAHLILELLGEQGSGKSTVVDMIKALLDPNKASRRTAPRDERDLMICASNNWLVSLDNLSGVQLWLSDALCRLSTGGALATRQLYTDNDETLFEAKRPVIVNGIGGVASRPDLLDRAITVTLPTISEDRRQSEQSLWQNFHQTSGKILGAILDAAACALKNISTTALPTMERMADAVLWVTAAEERLGWESGTFQKAYKQNRDQGNQTAIESAIIYEPLKQFLEDQPLTDGARQYKGTMSELLQKLNAIVGEYKSRQKQWPASPRGLRSALERIIPNLRGVGIKVEFDRKAISRNVILELVEKQPSQPSQPSQSSQPPETFKKSVTVHDSLFITDDRRSTTTVTKNHNQTNGDDGRDGDDGHLPSKSDGVDADLFQAEEDELHVDV